MARISFKKDNSQHGFGASRAQTLIARIIEAVAPTRHEEQPSVLPDSVRTPRTATMLPSGSLFSTIQAGRRMSQSGDTNKPAPSRG